MYPEMKEPSDLREQIAGKTSEELIAMCLKPHNWLPQSIAIAKEELTHRGVPIPGPSPIPRNVRGTVSLNGFGTKHYGQRDFRKDGSYVTTEWVVVAHIPIVPISSVRILAPYRNEDELQLPIEKQYLVCDRTKPNLKQVAFVYAYMLIVIVWVVLVMRIAIAIPPKEMTGPVKSALFVVGCVPLPLPWILRRIAQNAIK